MDEWVDIWSEDGRPTGQRMLKSEAHRGGLFHPTVHVWIYNSKREILLQKRSENKKTFPGKWDVSVAGHISAGDLPIDTAIRECEEELGLNIDRSALELIGILPSRIRHSAEILDCEFHHIYCIDLEAHPKELKLQEEEVSDVRWFPYKTILKMQENIGEHPDLVPLESSYLKKVFDHIESKFL